MPTLNEYDTVRIVQLLAVDRRLIGTPLVHRRPLIGDLGTIVHIEPTAHQPYVVESVDAQGFTVWLADFAPEEVEWAFRPA